MTNPSLYTPSSLAELLRSSAGKPLLVEWKVLTVIGPDWIGGGRAIRFSVDDQEIDDASAVFALLRDALIATFDIPESVEDACIWGEGTIAVIGNRLEIEYEIQTAVPYMYGASETGTRTLLTFESLESV